MINLDIPDPFMTTKTKEYGSVKGYQYDYFAQEWTVLCLACNIDLYSPTKYDMLKTHLYHTRNECLGGW
jgi:hypothetical protein